MWALRAQVDKNKYKEEMIKSIQNQLNLFLLQEMVTGLLIKNHQDNNQAVFSDEQAAINQQIMEVMGANANALYLAKMRAYIRRVRHSYIMILKKNPCNKSDVLTTLRADLIRLGWGKGSGVFGEGEIFPTYEAFLDWLIALAINIEKADITLKMDGKTDMTVTCQTA